MIQNVSAVLDHLLGDGLALGGIAEGLCPLAGVGDGEALLLVGILDARIVALLERLHVLRVDAADEADLAGGGHARCDITDGEGALLLLEGDAGQVGGAVVVGGVDDGELDVGVGVGSLVDRIAHGEADAPDELGTVVNGLVDVGHVVGVLLGLDVGDIPAKVGAELLHASPGELVEGLVVDATGIGDHRDLDVSVSRGGLATSGATAAAAGQNGHRASADGANKGTTGHLGVDHVHLSLEIVSLGPFARSILQRVSLARYQLRRTNSHSTALTAR